MEEEKSIQNYCAKICEDNINRDYCFRSCIRVACSKSGDGALSGRFLGGNFHPTTQMFTRYKKPIKVIFK